MLLQHSREMFDLGVQGRSWQSEKENASVSKALVEDQLTEIAVGNQQNALLSPSDGKNILISEAVRVIPRDCRNIVATLMKMGDQPKVGTLVEQEFHTGVVSGVTLFGGFGDTSSPVTIAFA